MTYTLCVLAGLLIGGLAAWIAASARLRRSLTSRLEEVSARATTAEGKTAALEATAEELRTRLAKRSEKCEELQVQAASERSKRVEAETRLEESQRRIEEQRRLLEEAEKKLGDAFRSLAGETLNKTTESFLKMAGQTFEKVLAQAKGDLVKRQEAIQGVVKPLSESLAKFDEHVREVEKNRQETYASLREQVKGLATGQRLLEQETRNLVSALRKPQVRGRWGEITLRRVVELSGMAAHCDFEEQVSVDGPDAKLRPDMIIRMPGGRELVVDAKVSLEAYLDAVEAASDEKREEALKRHAKQVRSHMRKLAQKEYWSQFPKAPDFVVMFIPGEASFSAAVEADVSLLEDAFGEKVLVATPMSLMALLRAVAYGWRQERIEESAQEISKLGKDLYGRMAILAAHLAAVGAGLEKANLSYNKAVRSVETRVLPAARRFKDLGATSADAIPQLSETETPIKRAIAPELLPTSVEGSNTEDDGA